MIMLLIVVWSLCHLTEGKSSIQGHYVLQATKNNILIDGARQFNFLLGQIREKKSEVSSFPWHVLPFNEEEVTLLKKCLSSSLTEMRFLLICQAQQQV